MKTTTRNEADARSNGGARLSEGGQPLHACVAHAIDAYFEVLDGAPTGQLYDLVMEEVERPLLQVVMHRTHENQSRAAKILGLNRGTLRKKLKQHGLLSG